ncbi:hypothetical protein Tco_0890756 [Tanacetum coccineum]|uniref:Uncharacterized protein n=1 Tax=Tanacetum coccineum TaxID=301880 RepID=A0ABQ5C6I1_9ASTR
MRFRIVKAKVEGNISCIKGLRKNLAGEGVRFPVVKTKSMHGGKRLQEILYEKRYALESTWYPMNGSRIADASKTYNGQSEALRTYRLQWSEITKNGKVMGRGIRKKGLYVMKLGNKRKDQICLATIDENSTCGIED